MSDSPAAFPDRLFDLSGKTALVTGAFGSLGRDFAQVLGHAGVTVILAGRRLPEGGAWRVAQRTARLMQQAGDAATRITGSVLVVDAGHSINGL